MARGRASSPKRRTTKPIPARKRNRIASSIRDGLTRNEVARKHSVAAGTVTRIAKAEGLSFDRSKTKNATEARQADTDAMKVKLAGETLTAAGRIFNQLFAQSKARHWYQGKMYERTIPQPTYAEQHSIASTFGTLIDQMRKLEGSTDTDTALAALQTWYSEMTGGEHGP